jgi:hypothetical protein
MEATLSRAAASRHKPRAESRAARKRLALELRRLADEWEAEGLKENLRMELLLILLRLG